MPRLQLARRNEVQWQHNGVDAVPRFSGFVLTSIHHAGGTEFLLDSGLQKELESSLNQLSYLRATRDRPMRGAPIGTGKRQPIGYSGEWTATLLARKANERVQGMAPVENTDDLRKSAEQSARLMDAVGAWLRHLQLANAVQVQEQLQTINTRVQLQDHAQSHDITEVGFGISQVLPVLVAGLLQPQNSLFIVDLPDAHLHPRPQAVLADFFCALALSGRTSLVETHSEMFFHRLRLQCELIPDLSKYVAVYFLDPPIDGVCSQPRQVGLNFDDELKWPTGFLQEAWELEGQIAAARRR